MKEVQIFKFDGKDVRIIDKDDNPWWVAKDVCEVLGLSDVSKSIERLDEDEKLTRTLFVSGQNREMLIINEPGLYSLILSSRKPEAKKFKRWVTHEVLPAIRKTGQYSVDLTPAEQLLKQAQLAVEIERKQIAQEKRITNLENHMHTSNSNYYTVLAYFRLKNIPVSIKNANLFGRRCGILARSLGISISKVPDERYGTVNAYHVDILDQIFDEN